MKPGTVLGVLGVCGGLLVGCHRAEPGEAVHRAVSDAGARAVAVVPPPSVVTPPLAAAPSATVLPAALPAASASAEPASESDFEDEFAYGGSDAGSVDTGALKGTPTYQPYGNGRFGFSLDVPVAFVAQPEPANGDGLQWRLGRDVVMTASGMYAIPELPLGCARSRNVTAHAEGKGTCWATGKRDGFIFWERYRLVHDTVYSLRFQYKESLKAAMAPLVRHINDSWKP